MRQLGIIFCLIFATLFHGSSGSGFDFNPHEVIRKSRQNPVDLDLGVRDTKASISYSVPTSITGNGADGLLQSANSLAAQADDLMIVLQSLLVHFNDTEGPEIEDVRNMTAQVKAFEEDYRQITDLIEQIQQTMNNNANNVTYIEKQLTCMKASGCNIGPTTPPPPVGYDCTVTTQILSKEGDGGFWTFANPTDFANCSILTIQSQKGLWVNLNITMGQGQVGLELYGNTSGNVLFDSCTNTSASLIDEPDTAYSIIITQPTSFSISFKAVGVCTVTNCNAGICSVSASNQPVCACKPCYADDVAGNKKCSVYTNQCDTHGAFCGDPNLCVSFANSTTCTYYCNCPDMPTDCPIKPQWCDGSTDCPTEKSVFDSRKFWKRHETFEDFDPVEFVQQAQEAETTLNFTMPDDIEAKDPYILLKDATNLASLANDLMSQLQKYLDIFNNTQSAPEWNTILPFENRLNNANATFGPLLDRFNDLKTRQNAMESSYAEIAEKLHCYQQSNCHIAPSTTTPPPPPEYNCSNAKTATVSKAGDSGSFPPFLYINQFNNCPFKIHSNLKYGLWINLQFSNVIFKGSVSTLTIVTSRDGNFTVNNTVTSFNNLTSDDITIYANGQLQFSLSYNAIDPCAGYDCGNGGVCGAVAPNNTQLCACTGCYQHDGNGRCTVETPNPCNGNGGLFCTASGGTCHETLECGYYCVCPQLGSSCHTAIICEDDVTDCPLPASSYKMPSIFSRFLKYFN